MSHTFRYVLREPPVPGATVTLAEADSHHLARVVRRRPGDAVELIDAEGRMWPAEVVAPGPPATLRLAAEPCSAPAVVPVDLFVGLAPWGRLDVVVEKAAELGLARVGVMASERAGRAPAPAAMRARLDRFARLAEAAARQSGRAAMPALEGLVAFDDVVAAAGSDGFLLDGRAPGGLAGALAERRPARAVLLIGPEAGFSAGEVERARAGGLTPAGLGTATLRVETAAIVAAATAAQALGHLGGAAP
jgi:16S rRNA (uracil1498-N3)-methyltransferase